MDESALNRRRAVVRSLSAILGHIKSLPPDYLPLKDEQIDASSFDDPHKHEATMRYIFSHHFSKWPAEVLSQFMQLSFLVANEAALAREDHPHLTGDFLRKPQSTPADESMVFESMIYSAGVLRSLALSDPTIRAKLRYVERYRSRYVPYENLIYTFLGPAAFQYFSLNSQEGRPKIQPNEVSREEWINLYKIDSQVRIDLELQALFELEPNQAKDVTAACWGLAAVMAHMSPSVFLCESEPYVSSVRADGGMTISSGVDTKVLLSFRPRSFVWALEFLLDSIADTVFDAADLMWIARAIVEVNQVDVPYDFQAMPNAPSYPVFLSHRGVDAKSNLAKFIIDYELQSELFLDCLAQTEGCVNRLFVFQNVVAARDVFVIQTERFNESPWCMKEKTLAKYLSSIGRLAYHEFATVESVYDAVREMLCADKKKAAIISREQKNPQPSSRRPLGPLWFIYSDLGKNDRIPNRRTLANHESFLASIDVGINRLNDVLADDKHDARVLSGIVVEIVTSLRDAALAQTTKLRFIRRRSRLTDIPLEVVTLFGQIAFGVLSVGSTSGSKVESRQAADTVAQLSNEFVKLVVDGCAHAKEMWFEYYIAMIVAVAIDFDREHSNTLVLSSADRLCSTIARLRGRQILFDVRASEKVREFRLRVAVLLITNGIGAIGIIQSSDQLIHNTSIDGFQLNVLPCVTLYPGMTSILNLPDDA